MLRHQPVNSTFRNPNRLGRKPGLDHSKPGLDHSKGLLQRWPKIASGLVAIGSSKGLCSMEPQAGLRAQALTCIVTRVLPPCLAVGRWGGTGGLPVHLTAGQDRRHLREEHISSFRSGE